MEKDMFFNQVIGLVRFSYPAKSGFKYECDTQKEREAILFDRARLERRFTLFESLCLPSLLAQSDSDFTCIFLIGENMPDWAKQRLTDGIGDLGNGIIIEKPAKHHYTVIKSTFETVSGDGFTHRTTFRLDDDDAISVNFIKKLKNTANDLQGMCKENTPVIISYNQGFYVKHHADGTRQIYDAVERTPLSVGTAMLAQIHYKDNIFARNHRFLPQFFNTWSDVSAPNFVRSIHQDNNSTPHIQGRKNTMDMAEVYRLVSEGFAPKVRQYLGVPGG